jgi:hypothetical protein
MLPPRWKTSELAADIAWLLLRRWLSDSFVANAVGVLKQNNIVALMLEVSLGFSPKESVHGSPQRRGESRGTMMANMSYCRFRNTLIDLRDCFGALEDMTTDEPVKPLSREELAAAEQLASTCLDLLRLLCEIGGDDLNDDLDPTAIVRCLNKAAALRR